MSFLSIFLEFYDSFHLAYLFIVHMKLSGQKWLDEMEQRNSEKNKKFLVLNDKSFVFNCWLLILEQILWLDIPLVKLDVFFKI